MAKNGIVKVSMVMEEGPITGVLRVKSPNMHVFVV